jgi:para-aminobenzoate synthetase component 1
MKSVLSKALTEEQVWNFADKFSHFVHLRGSDSACIGGTFQYIWAVGIKKALDCSGEIFEVLKNAENGKYYGYLTYDLKNEIEDLSSENREIIVFPKAFFFIPEIIIEKKIDEWHISADKPEEILLKIMDCSAEIDAGKKQKITLLPELSKEEYVKKARKIIEHIEEGDIYEMNFCTYFSAENVLINPPRVFRQLFDFSPMPFSSFIKLNNLFAFGASPERFLKKSGQKLLSQPIKGTAKRGNNPTEDALMIKNLKESEKERAENMMIVDLVRNDLAKAAISGTVLAEELFGIHTFKHLHQMISSITAQLKPDVHAADALKFAFPPGSMTGAPKIKAMELIEKFETGKRELFSGAIGFFDTSGDFDFNVVIRHIFYDKNSQKICAWAGSALTYDAIPEAEYEECLLKISVIKNVLESEV